MTKFEIGNIVRDTTVDDCRYAIGKDGFLDLRNGEYLPYDSAFPGPEWFSEQGVFEHVDITEQTWIPDRWWRVTYIDSESHGLILWSETSNPQEARRHYQEAVRKGFHLPSLERSEQTETAYRWVTVEQGKNPGKVKEN